MSIEALNWARKIYVGDAMAKALLRGIADYADENGHCFPSHARLAADCEMSIATIKRRMAQLEQLDILATFRAWIDEHGVRNLERRGRETSREIRLALTKRISPPAIPEGDPDPQDDVGGGAGSTPSIPDEGVLAAPPGESLVHPPNSEPSSDQKDSPLPPSGGNVAAPKPDLEGWNEFEEAWSKHGTDRPEPIMRQRDARAEWAKLSPDDRPMVMQAVRGYVAHRKGQRKPPNVRGAHLFLRERDAWPRFAALADSPAGPARTGIPSDSREAQAIRAMYRVARITPFESKGFLHYRGEITPQLMAFAGPDMDAPALWPWVISARSIASWTKFLDAHIPSHVPRPALITDGPGGRGLKAPWAFVPSVEGKTYPITGPPPPDEPDNAGGLMTDADYENFDQ